MLGAIEMKRLLQWLSGKNERLIGQAESVKRPAKSSSHQVPECNSIFKPVGISILFMLFSCVYIHGSNQDIADSSLARPLNIAGLHSAQNETRKAALHDLSIRSMRRREAKLFESDESLHANLISQLHVESDGSNRREIIQILSVLHSSAAYTVTSQIAQSDEELRTRLVAIQALPALDRTRAFGDLHKLWESNAHPGIRLESAKQLAQIGDQSVYDFALQNMRSSEPSFRWKAVEIVAKLHRKEALSELRKIAKADEIGSRAANDAILEIEYSDQPTAIDKSAYIKNKLLNDRLAIGWAVQKLFEIHDQESIKMLIDMAARSNPAYRSAVYFAKGDAKQALFRLYDDGSGQTQSLVERMIASGQPIPLP